MNRKAKKIGGEKKLKINKFAEVFVVVTLVICLTTCKYHVYASLE